MSILSGTASIVTASQVGLPAVLTNELFKQIASLMYIKTSVGGYFFDAVFHTDHSTHLVSTSHPVQNGANISDHCYMEPARVTLEIGMSDVGTGSILGQFSSGKSRSKAAFEALQKMQQSRQPVDVVTRLKSYKNMLIEDLSFPDDIKTYYGLRASISLKQVIIVSVAKVSKVSARPQVTQSVAAGNVVPVQPNQSIIRKAEVLRGIQ